MTHIALVADDLTGAADSAGVFAASGLSTAIPLGDGPLPDADVISISTDSRDIPENDAMEAVRHACRRLIAHNSPPGVLYKKLDSALRGHLLAELRTMMETLGERRVVVCPALPAEGRTTVGGRQLVNGAPLDARAFGGANSRSNLMEIFAPAGNVTSISLDTLRTAALSLDDRHDGIIVVDAETDADLRRIAELASAAGIRLLAGSAGLARAVAATARVRSAHTAPGWRPAAGRPILMIIGSRHDASARQIAYAASHGVCVIRPRQSCLDEKNVPLGDALRAAEDALRGGRDTLLTSAGLQGSPRGAVAVADVLASVLTSHTIRAAIGGLVLTGGDVAAAACRALGASTLWMRGEVRAALPWATLSGGLLPGLPIVTKAGSFGDDDSLIAAASLLSGASA